MIKKCIICKKKFSAREKLHKCCSDNCRKEYRKRNYRKNNLYKYFDKKCIICGKRFFNNKNKIYCSIECGQKIVNKRREQNKKYRSFNKKCLICNKIFLGNKIKKLCSEKCKHKAQMLRNKKYMKKRKQNLIELEKLRKQARERYYKSKDKISLYRKKFREQNKEVLKEREKLYRQNRMKNDIQYRLRKLIRDRIKNVVGHNYRSVETLSLLGCSVEELRQYLEQKFKKGMTWKNYGIKGWHIDHIIPCNSFDLTKIEEQRKCFHYSNLQPLWWYENLQKSDKVI